MSEFHEFGIHPFDRSKFRGQFGAAAVTDIADEKLQYAPGNSSSFHHFADVSVSVINQSVSVDDHQSTTKNQSIISDQQSAVEDQFGSLPSTTSSLWLSIAQKLLLPIPRSKLL